MQGKIKIEHVPKLDKVLRITFASIKKDLSETKAEFEALSDNVDSSLDEFRERLKKQGRQNSKDIERKTLDINSTFLKRTNEMEDQITRLSKSVEKFTTAIDKKIVDLETKYKKVQNFEKIAEGLYAEIKEVNFLKSELERVKILEKQIKLVDELSVKTKDFKNTISSSERRVNKKLDKLTLEKELLNKKLNDAISNESEKLNKLIDSNTSSIDKVKEDLNNEVSVIKDSLKTDFTKNKDDVESKVSKFKGDVESKLSKFKTNSDKEISKLKEDVTGNVSILKETLENNISDIKGDVDVNLSKLKGDLDLNVSKIKEDVDTKLSKVVDDLSLLDKKSKQFEKSSIKTMNENSVLIKSEIKGQIDEVYETVYKKLDPFVKEKELDDLNSSLLKRIEQLEKLIEKTQDENKALRIDVKSLKKGSIAVETQVKPSKVKAEKPSQKVTPPKSKKPSFFKKVLDFLIEEVDEDEDRDKKLQEFDRKKGKFEIKEIKELKD